MLDIDNLQGGFFKLKIDDDFRWVLLISGLICVQCVFTGFIIGGAKRKAFYDKEMLNKKYGEEHKKYFKSEITGSYPDHGNGLYSDLLTYEEWFLFNLDQRVHKNFLEILTIAVFNIIALGVTWSEAAIVLGIVQFVSRLIY